MLLNSWKSLIKRNSPCMYTYSVRSHRNTSLDITHTQLENSSTTCYQSEICSITQISALVFNNPYLRYCPRLEREAFRR